ncbi:uncharacterized protein Aud_004548 [Aspergillus udagawae]|uniref:Cyanovirin-N domain-containing protein n=1 Tax=Aspergillus udagawae TaxID=91492 RepID=A0A8E0QMR2_9EURO|nr:uncharacterized protein Aud_004548 [Aspergillus udagawae]GIC88157.1 hypothetical protein Aud_004548 [Aspergillus udagawae]
MVFGSASRDIYLRQEGLPLSLCATCKVGDDDEWKYSEISIDRNLGLASDGKFDITGCFMGSRLGWTNIMKPGTLQLKGTVMYGTLIDELGGHEMSICPDLFIDNDRGTLKKRIPPNDIYSSVLGLKLDPNTAVLSGYCLGHDGKLHYSELPLDEHFVNDNGIIKRQEGGDFASTATNIYLDNNWVLCADLLQYNPKGHYNSVEIEFAQYVHIEDGKFVMDDPAGLFDLRGPIMRFLEDIPVDEAKRAVAECTYSTLVTAGAIVGFALTGPIGASIGSAFGSMLGLGARAAIGCSINDPNLRNQVTTISTFQILMVGVSVALALPIGMITAGLTEALEEGLFEDGIIARALETAISKGDENLGKFGLQIIFKIVGVIQDDLAQGKSNEEIEADIRQLYGDDDGDGVNPLNDVTRAVKQAVTTAANKALQDAALEVENTVQGVAHDAAQAAVQELIQDAVQEVGQEAAKELLQEAGESSALLDVEAAAQAAVDNGQWGRTARDPVRTFLEVMWDIKKAREGAAQFVKDSVASPEKELENAKDTARKPFQGAAGDAASKAMAAAALIANLVLEVKAAATAEEPAAIALAAEQVDEAMQKAVQDATLAVKQKAAGEAQDAAQDFKEAVHKAVQKVKDAEQEVQKAVQDAVPDVEQTAIGKVKDAANAMAWQEEKGGASPNDDDVKRAAQGAVEGAVQDATESIQPIADAALQTALQELQAGPEVQKAVREAARDAVEDALSEIMKAVQDSVADAAGDAMPVFGNPRPNLFGGMEP